MQREESKNSNENQSLIVAAQKVQRPSHRNWLLRTKSCLSDQASTSRTYLSWTSWTSSLSGKAKVDFPTQFARKNYWLPGIPEFTTCPCGKLIMAFFLMQLRLVFYWPTLSILYESDFYNPKREKNKDFTVFNFFFISRTSFFLCYRFFVSFPCK